MIGTIIVMARSRRLHIHLFLSFRPLYFFDCESNRVFDIISNLVNSILFGFCDWIFCAGLDNLGQAHRVVESGRLIGSEIAAIVTLEPWLISLEWGTTPLKCLLLAHHLCSDAVKTLSDPVVCIGNSFQGLVLARVRRGYICRIFERRGTVSEKKCLRVS